MATTKSNLKADLKSLGLRLPHGYDVVKRTKKKRVVKKRKPIKRKK
ncbi:hypothetical protein I5M32_11190 [Pedobacter sp. SD-b]|uniref:Uncharacterized protein n=1 Tax=Pedobacter segetis TaxID=2793069 RepID=A0ABS1BKZ7_9SPHI|nr:hypothetical protein [Pedobacter segetis]MBK0383521.1 hypothetical protein [Pedobacter segetis]